MTKRFVAVLEISENDPYINDLPDLKEEIEKCLYLPGCVVSIKPMPSNLDWKFINETTNTDSFEYGRCCGRQELIDEITGEE